MRLNMVLYHLMTMKKILMMAVTAILAATGVQAQNGYEETKHEVAVGFGALSNSQWIDVFEDVSLTSITAGQARFNNEHFSGPISVEYFYHAKPWLGVGGVVAFGQNKQDMLLLGEKEGELKHSYYTLMPAVKLDWLRKQYFGMYSKLAVGLTLRTESLDSDAPNVKAETETMAHVNWQLSALGIEAGAPTLRGFVELGFGEQGIALIGLRYKF